MKLKYVNLLTYTVNKCKSDIIEPSLSKKKKIKN